MISYGVAESDADPGEVEALRRSLGADGGLLVGMVAAPDTESDVAFNAHDVLLGAIAALDRRDVRAVIVGHDPDFSTLASWLSDAPLALRKGALARIDLPDRKVAGAAGSLRWLLPPDAVPD